MWEADSRSETQVKRAIELIETNEADHSTVRVESRICGMNRKQLSKH